MLPAQWVYEVDGMVVRGWDAASTVSGRLLENEWLLLLLLTCLGPRCWMSNLWSITIPMTPGVIPAVRDSFGTASHDKSLELANHTAAINARDCIPSSQIFWVSHRNF